MVNLNMESRSPMGRVNAENRSKTQKPLGFKGLIHLLIKHSLSNSLNVDVIHKTRGTVFYQISKWVEKRGTAELFLTHFTVFGYSDETLL